MNKKRQKKKQKQHANKVREARIQALKVIKEQKVICDYYQKHKRYYLNDDDCGLLKILGSEPYHRCSNTTSDMHYTKNYILYFDRNTNEFKFSTYRHFDTDLEEGIYFDLRQKKLGV